MFVTTKKHDVIVAELRARNESLRQTNYGLDRTAAKYKAERDSFRDRLDTALDELKVFHDRRDKAKRNLRQFRKPLEPDRLPPIN